MLLKQKKNIYDKYILFLVYISNIITCTMITYVFTV